MSEREVFMARVRLALGREDAPLRPSQSLRTPLPAEAGRGRDGAELKPVSPVVDEGVVRRGWGSGDLVGEFVRNAKSVGMAPHRVTMAVVGEFVAGVLGGRGVRRVALGVGEVVERVGVELKARGVECVDWRGGAGMERLFGPDGGVDAGITDVRAAVAETGSLVCASDGGRGRGLSLVPPLHVAIVRASEIVPDLIDVFGGLVGAGGGAGLPSSVVLITGPSKTADIEGVLITGVHGPREVCVVVVE